MDSPLLITGANYRQLEAVRTEIVRSFAFKLNVGNYESRDFFCSQKAECRMDEAEKVSELLYLFCKTQVMKAVAQFKADAQDAFGPDRQRRA